MVRPTDTYTHSQFEPGDGISGESVRCRHCKTWTSNTKVLNRKKDHLLKCPEYRAWRAQGNGQDLLPSNPYTKRDSDGNLISSNANNNNAGGNAPGHPDDLSNYLDGLERTAAMNQPQQKRPDLLKFFDEFWDDSTTQKCMRVRCLSCGFVRAKNSTRQVEHLVTCGQFLDSPEGQQAIENGDLRVPGASPAANGRESLPGSAPNPTPNLIRRVTQGPINSPSPATPVRAAPVPTPSLASHLLRVCLQEVQAATQQQFLSKAGLGTLRSESFNAWLSQQVHVSRALVPFVGSLIGKIRIPETENLQVHPHFRAIDLLISSANNMKRELEFIESTKKKYKLNVPTAEPLPPTRGLLDLLSNASSPQTTLLEGLVCLWAIEHLFSASFAFANTFHPETSTTNPYTLPTNPSPSTQNLPHNTAIHEAFIPNWSSPAFERFVGACKAIVDELANAQTSGNGRAEMMNCERVFRQAVWLWGQYWPDVSPPAWELEARARAPVTAADIRGETDRFISSRGMGISRGDRAGVEILAGDRAGDTERFISGRGMGIAMGNRAGVEVRESIEIEDDDSLFEEGGGANGEEQIQDQDQDEDMDHVARS